MPLRLHDTKLKQLSFSFSVPKVSPRSTEFGKSYGTFPEESTADLETVTPNASPEAYKLWARYRGR